MNCTKLYHLDLVLHLQWQVLQCLASWHLHMSFTVWGMWVGYLSCITSVWLTYGKDSYIDVLSVPIARTVSFFMSQPNFICTYYRTLRFTCLSAAESVHTSKCLHFNHNMQRREPRSISTTAVGAQDIASVMHKLAIVCSLLSSALLLVSSLFLDCQTRAS